MLKHIILFNFMFLHPKLFGQPPISTIGNNNNPSPGSKISKYIPTGYTILYHSEGDLNLDKYPDMVVVLKQDNEDSDTANSFETPTKRILLLFTGDSSGQYHLAARNDSAVLCRRCTGLGLYENDPFNSITIKKGYFTIEQSNGDNNYWFQYQTTFKYKPTENNWILIKDHVSGNHGMETFEETKTVKNFGRVLFEQFNIYKKE